MKPLVTTVRALRELATGVSPNALETSEVLYPFSTAEADFLIAAQDAHDVQRITVVRDKDQRDPIVPDHLQGLRVEALSRMASFAERALSRPFTLPRGWGQYKHDSFVAFFVVSRGDSNSTRWICEVGSGETPHVVFCRTTTSTEKSTLQEFARNREPLQNLDNQWNLAFESAQAHFQKALKSNAIDVDMYLPPVAPQPHRRRTFDEWLEAASDDQRLFINASADRSIRLRGPAGSGKTLALVLKAIREVLAARSQGSEIRVLMVTHSWALAAQIDQEIKEVYGAPLDEVEVLPLLGVGQLLTPIQDKGSVGFTLIGDDSESGKRAQLDQIREVLDDFIAGDWITYRSRVTSTLRDRFESDEDGRQALTWDLLIEFGSVIGAAAIFPGAGSEQKYLQLQRARWMVPLDTREDRKVVFELYSRFMKNLEERSLVTSDQVLADFLSHLETHFWNRARRSQGYDLVFVDEFHLFSPLERQVLPLLTNDVASYPRLFMAVDPRQSPSESFIGVAADETWASASGGADENLEGVDNFELTTVHRFTPQILALVKHVHLMFPTYDLGSDWDVDFARVESTQDDGPLPRLVHASSREGMENDIYRAVHDLYPRGRIALAIVDPRQWGRFSEFAARLSGSAKFHVSTISGRSDIEGLGYRNKGVVVGSAEYLAGLQFDTVLVAGVPDLRSKAATHNERTRMLSFLYLALSRAEKEVRVFVNDDEGGAADVLTQAVSKKRMTSETGSV